MPDAIRANVGVLTRPRAREICAALAASAVTFPTVAAAEETGSSPVAALLEAAFALDRYEVAALALTLGVIFFATVTAIMLVRTRARASAMDAQARADILALKAEVDRVKTLLLSEPQVIVVWTPAGA